MEWSDLGTFVTGLGTFVALFILAYKFGEWKQNVQNAFAVLFLIHGEEIFKLYDKFFPPHSEREPEKQRLLRKLREGTIAFEEGERLKRMLESQRKKAMAGGAIAAALIIGALLLLLMAILARKE